MMPHRVSSCLTMSHHIPWWVTMSQQVLRYFTRSLHVSACLNMSHRISSYLMISDHVSPGITMFHQISSCLNVSHLSRRVSTCFSGLSRPVMSHHISSCLITSHRVSSGVTKSHHVSPCLLILSPHVSSNLIIACLVSSHRIPSIASRPIAPDHLFSVFFLSCIRSRSHHFPQSSRFFNPVKTRLPHYRYFVQPMPGPQVYCTLHDQQYATKGRYYTVPCMVTAIWSSCRFLRFISIHVSMDFELRIMAY